MSEHLHVEKPFLDQLAALGWQVTDQGVGHIPSALGKSLRASFREWFLPEVFHDAIRSINVMQDGHIWLTDRQLHAINQFRVETPGCVKMFIIPDIVLFVKGIPARGPVAALDPLSARRIR